MEELDGSHHGEIVQGQEGSPEAVVLLKEGRKEHSERHFKKAAELFRQSATEGNAEAAYELAKLYNEGRGAAKHQGKSFKWMNKAYEMGNKEAAVDLGVCYAHGLGVGKDGGMASRLWSEAAYAGVSKGFYFLASEASEKEDSALAAKYYRIGAEKGLLAAQYSYAVCCLDGSGIVASEEEGRRWLEKCQETLDSMADDDDEKMMFSRIVAQRMGKLVPKKGNTRSCKFCGAIEEDKTFPNCARCKVAVYCGVECQRKDWKTHKKECKAKK